MIHENTIYAYNNYNSDINSCTCSNLYFIICYSETTQGVPSAVVGAVSSAIESSIVFSISATLGVPINLLSASNLAFTQPMMVLLPSSDSAFIESQGIKVSGLGSDTAPVSLHFS